MSDETLQRYARQILLPDVSIEGQQRLSQAHATVVGVGGLGCVTAAFLARAGIGRLTLIDDDAVELSNLHRQILFDEHDIGRLKVEAAAERMRSINPAIDVITHASRLNADTAAELTGDTDVFVDGTDSYQSRLAVNAASLMHRRPMVFGAALRLEGQVSVFQPNSGSSPCYRCVFSPASAPVETCVTAGVVGPLLGIIGSLQAMEALKLLLEMGDSLVGRLLTFDARTMEWMTIHLHRNPDCPACSG